MTYTVRLLPERRSCTAREPMDLAEAAAQCEVLLEQPCGSRRTCGKCRVRVLDGAPAASDDDRRVLDGTLIDGGWRLGCALVLDASATVEIPRAARGVPAKSFGPADLFRGGGIAPAEPLAVRRALDRGVTPWGVAVDVGSTTLAAALVRLDTGEVAATASALNPQVRFGADVVSRIRYAMEHREGAARLQEALARSVDELIATCAGSAGLSGDVIVALACVGNPTMVHTLVGQSVAGLGQAPYEGSLRGAWHGRASVLGLTGVDAATPVYVPPAIRSHVGADAVAAVLAEGLDRAEQPVLLIDVGTNTEIVLASRDHLVATSAAAGPAFEGATIHQGMRAAPGAIELVRVRADGSIRIRTIGNAPPAGLCGSGLVDAVAELLHADAIEPSGRLRAAHELPPGRLRDRIVELPTAGGGGGGGRAVRLTPDAAPAVYLTAADVRQLQLVKGSIAASAHLLLRRAGLTPADLGEVLIAGAFGGWIRTVSALAIGLVPPVDPERIRFVGDAAAAGARLVLVDRGARRRADRLAARAEYVELAGRQEYADAFVDNLSLVAEEGVT